LERKMSAKILIIDDSTMVRQQVSRALTGAGFVMIQAVDGLDALEKLAGNPDTRLVVCDVNMPKMNGLEFLESVSRSGHARGVPIVMLTTEGQAEMIQRAKDLGAKGWIVKPFKPELLIAAVKKVTAQAA
jgi:two-component system, chemotaxis family, chemotaxis protein CheY